MSIDLHDMRFRPCAENRLYYNYFTTYHIDKRQTHWLTTQHCDQMMKTGNILSVILQSVCRLVQTATNYH